MTSKVQAGNSASSQGEASNVIDQSILEAFSDDLSKYARKAAKKFGLSIGEVHPKILNHGTGLSVSVRGGLPGIKQIFRRVGGASREAIRFIENHESVGLDETILDAKVRLKDTQKKHFIVVGLKGQKNDVVLKDVASAEMSIVPVGYFKENVVVRS